MADTRITVELSPEIYIALKSLCAFYKKNEAQVIEMALENMAADSKLIIETFEAKIKRIEPNRKEVSMISNLNQLLISPKYRERGFSVKEIDDHILVLLQNGKEIAHFSQTGVTLENIVKVIDEQISKN